MISKTMNIPSILRVLLLLSTVHQQKCGTLQCKFPGKDVIKWEYHPGQTNTQVSKHVYYSQSFSFCRNDTQSMYTHIYHWLRFSKHRTLKYASINCTRKALRLFLIVVSGLETNPGPRKPKFPCGLCTKACKLKCIACDECDLWWHKSCVGLTSAEFKRLGSGEDIWNCPSCHALNSSGTLYTPPTQTLTGSTVLGNISDNFSIDSSIIESISDISHISGSSVSTAHDDTDSSFTGTKTPPISSSPRVNKPRLKPREKLRVLNINFQSVRKKGKLLESIIDSAEPDIIIGTETWLTDEVRSEEILSASLEFDVYRRDRPTDAHGGVLIAVRRDLMLNDIVRSDNVELISGKIKSKDKTIVIAAFYRPPNRVEESYLKTAQEEIAAIRHKNKTAVLIVAGDFNLPDINWSTMSIEGSHYPRRVNETFLNLIADNNLEQQVDFPTRKENILDIILTTHPSYKIRCKPLPSIGNSDHDIVLYDTSITAIRQKPSKRKLFLWKRANLEKIKADIVKHNNDRNAQDGAEEAWNNFKKMLLATIQKNVPSKYTEARHSLPWMTGKIKRCIKRKQKAHKKARRTKKKKDRDRYRRLQLEARFLIRDSNRQYMEDVVSENHKGNPKKFWAYVKSKRQDSSGVPPLKDKDGFVRSDSLTKAEILNAQFQSVYTRESMSHLPDMGSKQQPDMDRIIVNRRGVQNLLEKLNPHKAPGPDGVSPFILRAAAEEIAPILTDIYQKSLDTGVVPIDWKEAVIVPAYKKGDRSNPENYRPISLTSISSKVLEHVVHSSVMRHCDKHQILCDNQHGFRKRRSCESQLIVTIDKIARNYAKNKQVDVILLDFSKAFDKVPHSRLLHKLEHYGVGNSTIAWIKAFLQNRRQSVYVDGSESGKLDVISGVPQGTVLGPLLFLLYINDLPKSAPHSDTRLFADDSLVYRTISTATDATVLQDDISNLERWEQEWQMEFNPHKCSVIRIVPQSKKCIPTSYTLHGVTLSIADSSKYLGVDLNKDLSWDKHITTVVGKANKTQGFLRRNFSACTKTVKRETYTTMVRPSVEYAASIWDPTSVKNITLIEKVQRRGARFVTGNYWDRSPGCVTAMIADLGWESLEERRKHIRLSMLYKIVHEQVDIEKSLYLQSNDRRTRGQSRFFQERITNKVLEGSFFPRTIKDWNVLPKETVESSSLEVFRQRLSKNTQLSPI
jgi:hypothetical protein